MTSRFYQPQTPFLQELVHAFWQVERFAAFHQELILPKGIVEVIFNFSAPPPVRAQLDDKRYQVTNCFINGFNTTPIQLLLPSQQVLFGVVLQPLAVKKLLKVPAGEFSNQLVEVTLLDAAFESLWHQLAEQATFEQRVSLLSGWLERRYGFAQRQEKRINQFLYAANQHTVTVPALAQALCYSPRQLARKMGEATGLNTEEILVYKKYLHALHLMHHSQLSLTQIAYQSHFADQSHFSKTFKAYANMTPSQYLRQKNFLQGHLYESAPSAENPPRTREPDLS